MSPDNTPAKPAAVGNRDRNPNRPLPVLSSRRTRLSAGTSSSSAEEAPSRAAAPTVPLVRVTGPHTFSLLQPGGGELTVSLDRSRRATASAEPHHQVQPSREDAHAGRGLRRHQRRASGTWPARAVAALLEADPTARPRRTTRSASCTAGRPRSRTRCLTWRRRVTSMRRRRSGRAIWASSAPRSATGRPRCRSCRAWSTASTPRRCSSTCGQRAKPPSSIRRWRDWTRRPRPDEPQFLAGVRPGPRRRRARRRGGSRASALPRAGAVAGGGPRHARPHATSGSTRVTVPSSAGRRTPAADAASAVRATPARARVVRSRPVRRRPAACASAPKRSGWRVQPSTTPRSTSGCPIPDEDAASILAASRAAFATAPPTPSASRTARRAGWPAARRLRVRRVSIHAGLVLLPPLPADPRPITGRGVPLQRQPDRRPVHRSVRGGRRALARSRRAGRRRARRADARRRPRRASSICPATFPTTACRCSAIASPRCR